MNLQHLTEVKSTDTQNAELEIRFKEFYKLDSSPKIRRFLRHLKDSPAELMETYTEFELPSGKVFYIDERFDKPNGVSETILLNGEQYRSYFHAETQVLTRFLEEIHGSHN